MRFCVLGSGSKGNSTYVEAGDVRILIDAGFSGVEIERRLLSIGVDPATLSAIFVTHEHDDHIRGLGILSRKYRLTVYATQATLASAALSPGRLHQYESIEAGTLFLHRHLIIHPFAISHDAADPVGFVIAAGGKKLGYCTDTGMVSRLMRHRLSGCHGLVLECNHDLTLLKNGPYPEHLKQRVRSTSGHLANDVSAAFLNELCHENLEHVVLAHISETNNDHAIIEREFDGLAGCRLAGQVQISLARQDRAGDVIRLEGP